VHKLIIINLKTKNIRKILEKQFYYLENEKIPYSNFILTFIFIILIRLFLEFLLGSGPGNFSEIIHFTLWFISVALIFIIISNYTMKGNIIKSSRVIFSLFIVVLVAPLINFFTKYKGLIGYLNPSDNYNILYSFLTFFGEFKTIGITPGLRIELFLIFLGTFFYIYIKTKKIVDSFFSTFLLYTITFIFSIKPIIESLFLKIINTPLYTNIQHPNTLSILHSHFFIVLTFIFALLSIIIIANKKVYTSILKDIRPYRTAHYSLMFFLGVSLAYKVGTLTLNQTSIFSLIILPISIILAWIYSVMTNNIEDLEIDKITNKTRPLVKNNVNLETYKKHSFYILLIALLFAALVNFVAFLIIGTFMGTYFLYSMKPLRLKRVTFLSKIVISFNSLILIMLGFYIFNNNSLVGFPSEISIFCLIFLTAIANFIDIKDYLGDKANKIKTLPVLFGLKNSKRIIGFFFLISYLVLFFYFQTFILLFPLLFLGILQFYFITKENYNEKNVLSLNIISIIGLISYILFF